MLTKSSEHNPNYLATIVKIENLRKHSNADRLQCANVFANNVITSLNCQVGALYVFFPLESAISPTFLAFTNSYEDKGMNQDNTVKGYFNKAGRVRAIRLRGERSEGYMVPVSELETFAKDVLKKRITFTEEDVGKDFDELFGHRICQKYMVPVKGTQGAKKTKGSLKKYESKLVDGQFRLHYDTEHLKRHMDKISPDDVISISNKVHGTSFVVANVLTKKRMTFIQRLLRKFGVPVVEEEYNMLYASRCVIKNQNFLDSKDTGGFYKEDIWKLAADKLFPFMFHGLSVYGEIVGYTPGGGFIQKDYDYGCEVGQHDIYIYRLTFTSANGHVYELPYNHVVAWANKNGVKAVETYYQGKAKDLYPDIPLNEFWHDEYLSRLIRDYLEKDCHICKNVVPDEGIVLRKDVPNDYQAFKLKSFKFLERETKELDAGKVDTESEQATLSDDDDGNQ
jgi:hypothetical protein